jgi:hypothetical protein
MAIKRKHPRAPRVLVDRRSSAITANPDLTTSVDAARETATALEATQPLVRYPDHRGGFSRIGRLTASCTVKRERDKGMVIMTIVSMLNQTLTFSSDEVEFVYDHKSKAAPPVGAD